MAVDISLSGLASAGKTTTALADADLLLLTQDSSGESKVISVANASAAEAKKGMAELATTSEVTTETDDARIVTPLKLKTGLSAWQQLILKPSDTTKSADTTLAADPHLQFAMRSGETWWFDFLIEWSHLAANADLKFQIVGPSAGDKGDFLYDHRYASAGSATSQPAATRLQLRTTYIIDWNTVADPIIFLLSGWINATATGTFSFTWAQNTANSSTTVKQDSRLQARRIG